MGTFKINLLKIILFLLLIPFAYAETTFFDQEDIFIMGNSPTTLTSDSGVTGGGGCIFKWNCTNWSECLSYGKQTRNCTNIGTCLGTYNSPKIEQNCTYITPEINKEGNKPEKINVKEIAEKNKVLIYFIIALIILFIIFYLKKNYFKKIKKRLNKYQNKIKYSISYHK